MPGWMLGRPTPTWSSLRGSRRSRARDGSAFAAPGPPWALLTGLLVLATMAVVAAVVWGSVSRSDLPLWSAPAPGARAWETFTLLVVLIAAGVWSWWFPRRRTPHSAGAVAATGLTVVTVALALPTYVAWTGDQGVPFWAPVGWTLGLFIGNVEEGLWNRATPPVPVPLAIQMARVSALVTVFAAIGGLVATVATNQIDRLAAVLARRVVLVTGVDRQGLDLVEAMTRVVPRGTAIVAVEADPQSGVIGQLRQLGVRVVIGDARLRNVLEPLIVRRLRKRSHNRLRTAYLLSPSASRNAEVGRALQEVCGEHPRVGGVARMVVRVDRPLQAEDWRRRALGDDLELLTDTTGTYQVTAQEIVDVVSLRRPTDLLLLGGTVLTLAILDELAQHRREHVAMDARPDDLESLSILLIGRDGQQILDDHERHQARYGNAVRSMDLRVVAEDDVHAALESVDVEGRSVVVVNTADPDPARQLEAERLAASHPGVEVMSWVAEQGGIPRRSVMGNLTEFGLTLVATRAMSPQTEPRTSLPEDGWTRVARRLHEQHLVRIGPQTTVRQRDRAWDDLSDFYRESNVRQVWVAMQIATLAGRTFIRPTRAREAFPLSAAELDAFAPHEHDSWVAFYQANGWRRGPRREQPGRRRLHDALVPWSELSKTNRDYTRAGLRDSLLQLATLGFVPFAAASTSREEIEGTRWRYAGRRGNVDATRRDSGWTWTTETGTTMTAAAGDWDVRGPEGDRWSVKDPDFRASHEHVDGRSWRRTGAHLSRPADPGELVPSQEGAAVASLGDWVMADEVGHRWLVPSAQFNANYEVVADPEWRPHAGR